MAKAPTAVPAGWYRALVSIGCLQHRSFREPTPADLLADGQAVGVEAAGKLSEGRPR
jgi:hypothetical protein